MLTHQAFVNLLKMRYDHFSATIMAKELLGLAGLKPQDEYDKDAVEALTAAIRDSGDPRSDALVAAFEGLLGGGEKKAPAAEEKKTEKKAEKKSAKKGGKKK